MGWTPTYSSDYGLSTWNGPHPLIPYSDWHGAMAGATTSTGRRVPCSGTPDLCSNGIWPGSSLSAFYDPRDPIDQQAWFGSLTTGKTDGSNFMYMRNRYYNPQTGTFTQPDPIGVAGGLNVYGFAEGDPVAYRDPFGLTCVIEGNCLQELSGKIKRTALEIGLGALRTLNELGGMASYMRATTGRDDSGHHISAGRRVFEGGLAALLVVPGDGEGEILGRFVSILRPGGRLIGEAGTSSAVRFVSGGMEDARAMFSELSEGGELISQSATHTTYQMEGGAQVTLRTASRSGHITIDINDLPGLGVREVKFK